MEETLSALFIPGKIMNRKTSTIEQSIKNQVRPERGIKIKKEKKKKNKNKANSNSQKEQSTPTKSESVLKSEKPNFRKVGVNNTDFEQMKSALIQSLNSGE